MKKIMISAALAAAALGLTLCAGPMSSAGQYEPAHLSTTHLLANGIDPTGLPYGQVRTTGDHHITNGHEADAVVGPARRLTGM